MSEFIKTLFEEKEKLDEICHIEEQQRKKIQKHLDTLTYADNEINEKVTLKIHVKESVSKKHGDVILFGKILSHATGRDSGAHPGSDVAYIHGSAYSGGSAKNWESVVSEDSEILLHNVNKNLYEEYLENPQEEYEIEVVTDSIDSAALKQEKERLLKRIKEIDHVLNCEG